MAEKTELYFEEYAPKGLLDKINIFKKKTKATVSTTMFIDHSGDQYPIRNITSVKIKYNMPKFFAALCKWMGIVIFVLGLLFVVINDDPEANATFNGITIVGLLFLGIWANAKVFITIGAGGSEEPAYPLFLRNKGAEEHVKRLATAINNAISDLQNK